MIKNEIIAANNYTHLLLLMHASQNFKTDSETFRMKRPFDYHRSVT